MFFSEALNKLVAGHYVTRTVWDATGDYCVLMPGMPYIWKIMTQPTPNAGNHLLSVADLLADDWKAYSRKSEEGIAVGEYNPADPNVAHDPVPPCS